METLPTWFVVGSVAFAVKILVLFIASFFNQAENQSRGEAMFEMFLGGAALGVFVVATLLTGLVVAILSLWDGLKTRVAYR